MYTTIDTPCTIVTISFLFFPYLFHYLVYTTLTFIFYKEKIFDRVYKAELFNTFNEDIVEAIINNDDFIKVKDVFITKSIEKFIQLLYYIIDKIKE